MKKRGLGIFGKLFLYTLIFIIIVFFITVAVFAGQLQSAYDEGRKQQLRNAFQTMINEIEANPESDMIDVATRFHETNTSLDFTIQSTDGTIIFETGKLYPEIKTNVNLPQKTDGDVIFNSFSYIYPLENGATLYAFYSQSDSSFLLDIIQKTALILGILFIFSIIGAAIFARRISNPIKRLAIETTSMAALQDVEKMKLRNDEIGLLQHNVYAMYDELKNTILKLENEIDYKNKLEESQRYFFSAASHELKTPIAAMSALIEEMLEKLVEPEEYPSHLKECMMMISFQKKLISELLEIVRLTDGRIINEPKIHSLSKLIDEILPVYKTLAIANNQNIIVKINPDAVCYVDSSVFTRVVSNVLLNAVQNSPAGASITLQDFQLHEKNIELHISNSDAKIDEEVLEKIYEPFFRADKARSRNQGQSGLGLTIVKRSLDAVDIPFVLENTNMGVVFKMTLPKID